MQAEDETVPRVGADRVLHLILNGKVAQHRGLRGAVDRLRQQGVEVLVHVTWEAGDAQRHTELAARDERAIVVAGGGDGTVHEVVNGMLSAPRRVPVAVLPLGTANDFAHAAGLPVDDLDAALALAARGTPSAIDVGVANGRYFVNMASGGIGARATTTTPPALKELLGGSAYALTALVESIGAEGPPVHIHTPGESFSTPVVVLAVGNARRCGGGHVLAPRALINDGHLDLLVVPDTDHERIVHLIADLAELRHGERAPHFRHFRLAGFSMECEVPIQVNLDGERCEATRFDFSVLPGAVDVVLPPDCPLLDARSFEVAA